MDRSIIPGGSYDPTLLRRLPGGYRDAWLDASVFGPIRQQKAAFLIREYTLNDSLDGSITREYINQFSDQNQFHCEIIENDNLNCRTVVTTIMMQGLPSRYGRVGVSIRFAPRRTSEFYISDITFARLD
ncbi:MAG: hypothetical protein K2X11_10880 [Acetobacteraceae bacterium]|nr:hypothetical protein [Acetobacteraceae bacterium]